MENIQKTFLQICLNRGFFKMQEVEAILQELCKANEHEEDAIENKQIISEINKNLKQYDQALTVYRHPLADNEEFLVFGYTKEMPISKRQAHYTDVEKHYFMKLLETILHKDNFGISWLDVYQVADTIPGTASSAKQFSKQRMQELITSWTGQGYLLEKTGILYPGPRMMVEYENHMKINYEDLIHKCPLCLKLVFWDIACSSCNAMLHRECIRKYLTKKSDCPSCCEQWNTPFSQSQSQS